MRLWITISIQLSLLAKFGGNAVAASIRYFMLSKLCRKHSPTEIDSSWDVSDYSKRKSLMLRISIFGNIKT